MPLYEFKCSSCNNVFDEFLSIDNRHLPESLPCRQCGAENTVLPVMGTPPIADPVRLGRIKPSHGFRDLLRNIKARNPGSTLSID